MLPTLDSSLLFLFLGKENPWIPWILLAILLVQKGHTIMDWMESRLWMWGRAEYNMDGTLYTNKASGMTHGNLSMEMEAFLHFLQTSKITHSIQKGITIHTGALLHGNDTHSVTIPISGHGIWVQPGLYAKFRTQTEHTSIRRQTEDDASGTMLEECKLMVALQAYKGNFTSIRTFVQDCMKAYESYKNEKNNHCYVVKPSLESGRGLEYESSRYIPFKSNKTFDNLFFRGKAELLHRLEQFKNAESPMIQRMGLPSTLGLLFYGEPGTGKTSAIKAIANYMQMHLIIVPMNKIKTRRDLERVFYDNSVCYLNSEKRIYVFEEIDCNGWEKIVTDRKLLPPKEESRESSDWDTVDERGFLPSQKRIVQKRKQEEDDKLTLGAILELLDGVVETPGRMVIMTTNRRGILDPALIRPGRIDMEIEFGRLNRAEIAEIYAHMWEMQPPAEDMAVVPENRFTQAEISQLLYKCEDPKKFLSALVEHGRISVPPTTG